MLNIKAFLSNNLDLFNITYVHDKDTFYGS